MKVPFLKKIEPQLCKIYLETSVGIEYIGLANQEEFDDFRVQIKDSQSEGYYAEFNINNKNTVLKIDKDGRYVNWQKGMFDRNLDNLWLLL